MEITIIVLIPGVKMEDMLLHVMLRAEVIRVTMQQIVHIKTQTADNKERDDGDSLLADDGDKDHGADVRDKDEVNVATNAWDRGYCDTDEVTTFDY